MSLNTAPCFGHHCMGSKDQLAVLVLLSCNQLGKTFESMTETVLPTHRGLTETQAYENLIGEFTAEQQAAVTPEALACWKCLTEQQLQEAWNYCVQQAIAALNLQ